MPEHHGQREGNKRRLRESTTGIHNNNSNAAATPRGKVQHENGTPTTEGKVKEKSQPRERTFMDRWVEPTLAAPKASYTDHGGLPYGVLEHMQPLGEAPNAKVKARVKAEGRKSGVRGSLMGTGVDVQNTPEGSPAPNSHQQQQQAAMDGGVGVGMVQVDDEKDEDYAPEGGKRKTRVVKQTARRRGPVVATNGVPVAGPGTEAETKMMMPKKKKMKATGNDSSSSQVETQTNGTGEGLIYPAEKIRNVVDEAKSRAIAVGKPELADTVEELYQESLTNMSLEVLLHAVVGSQTTPEQFREFQAYVKAAKKRRQEANKSTPSRNSLPAGKATTSTSTPATATADARPASKGKGKDKDLDAPRPKLSIKLKSSPASTSTTTAKHANGTAPPAGVSTTPVKATPTKKPRSDSMGSDSSLTSFTSNDDDGRVEVDGTDAVDVSMEGDTLAPPPQQSSSRGTKRPSADAFPDSDDDRYNSHSKKPKGKTAAGASSKTTTSTPTEDSEQTLALKKAQLKKRVVRDEDVVTVQESNIRPSLEPPPPPPAASDAKNLTAAARRERRSRVRASYAHTTDHIGEGVDDDETSSLSDVNSPTSERNTPPPWKVAPAPSGPTTKTTGKRAKTKQSPEKKQHSAVYGALSAVGGITGKISPAGDDDHQHNHQEEGSENNDFCAACGGAGYLLCCDGCDRSFHFSCLDPPLSEDAKELDEPWYCFVCIVSKRGLEGSPEKPARGLFAPLLNSLRKRNPENFKLPADITNYFEGVAADKNGAFVESLTKTTRHRAGYGDEQPDYLRERDSKGNIILCYHCGQSSQRRRMIVTCDFCAQHWHLDCLDPPLANPPAVTQNGRKTYDWMCPLHADQELRKVDMSVLERRKLHLRRPKNAKVVDAGLSRGFRNNGIIEVLDDDSDGSDSEFYEHEDGPVVYRLPSKGIMLDFIDKAKTNRFKELLATRALTRPRENAAVAATSTSTSAAADAQPKPPSPLEQANFAKRSFIEKHLALNLAQLARENKDLALGQDVIANLVGTLIAEAPAEVVKSITAAEETEMASSATAAVPPSPPPSEKTEMLSVEQRKNLEILQELIRRKLECADS